MRSNYERAAALLIACACGPGAGGTEDATGTSGTAGVTSTSSTGGDGVTSVVTSTSAAPTGSGEVTGADPSTTTATSTGEAPVCREWHEYRGCPDDWPGDTEIHGEGIGTFTGAVFGIAGNVCVKGNSLARLALGNAHVFDTYLQGSLACGPEGWLGVHTVTGEVWSEQEQKWIVIEATLTVDSFAGDWDSEAPIDPPRISGSLAGALVGSFEAVRCAAVDTFIGNCA